MIRPAEALELDLDDWSHGHAVAHLTTEHPQVPAWPEGNRDFAHHLDHRDWIYEYDLGLLHARRNRRPGGGMGQAAAG